MDIRPYRQEKQLSYPFTLDCRISKSFQNVQKLFDRHGRLRRLRIDLLKIRVCLFLDFVGERLRNVRDIRVRHQRLRLLLLLTGRLLGGSSH